MIKLIFEVPDTIKAASLTVLFDDRKGLAMGSITCDTAQCRSGKPIKYDKTVIEKKEAQP